MQKVSNEYKASMKSSLRERSYMMISFGLVNQEAQANATVMGNNFAITQSRPAYSVSEKRTLYMPHSNMISQRLTDPCIFFQERIHPATTTTQV